MIRRYHFDGHFPTPVDGQFLADGDHYMLTQSFTFRQPGLADIVVPEGFITDWNSVPWGLWNFFAPWQYPEAGIVHDYLYLTGETTRQQADATHSLILKLLGVGAVKRFLIYWGLRIGGGSAWIGHRADDQPKGTP